MTRNEILQAVGNGTISKEDAFDLLSTVVTDRALSVKIPTVKVEGPDGKRTDTGLPGKTVAVYGLGRFPVSLYANQWEKLAAFLPQVMAFIAEHPELPRKQ